MCTECILYLNTPVFFLHANTCIICGLYGNATVSFKAKYFKTPQIYS